MCVILHCKTLAIFYQIHISFNERILHEDFFFFIKINKLEEPK